MNIIEALFITLGLDTSDYQKKQDEVQASLVKLGEVSDKQTKIVAESGKKAAQTFSMLKVEVLGALAAFGVSTGFKSFIEANMNGQAALGRMAANLGMSTQKLEAWKLAAKEMGQSGEEATNALQSVAKGIAEAQLAGHSSLTDASRRFGFAIDVKSPDQTLINISRRMAEVHDRQQAMQIANAAGVGNISNLLLQGPDALQAQLAHTMSLTGAATKDSTDQAMRLQAAWADLQERFQQVGERAFNKLEPVLVRLGDRFANWLDGVDWQKVIDGISQFIDKVQQVVKDMGGWKVVAEILGGVMALKLLAPLISLIATMSQLIPLLAGAAASTTAAGAAFGILGSTALVAATAFGGWKLGEWIASNLSDENLNRIGQVGTSIAALAGSKDAQEAISQGKTTDAITDAMNDPNVDQAIKDKAKGLSTLSNPAVIRLLAAHQRALAKASGQPEAGSEVGSDFWGSYDPQKSRKYGGNNAYLFDLMERRYGLPSGTLERKFEAESAKGTRLISSAGALGPMQFMPGTAQSLGLTTGVNGNVMDLDASAEAAAKYLAQLHKQFGDWDKAEAAYNWGAGNLRADIAKHGDQWLAYSPAETQHYVSMHHLIQWGSPLAGHAQQGPGNNTVTIGTLQVNAPKATDANGIAKDMQKAMKSNPLIAGNVTSLA